MTIEKLSNIILRIENYYNKRYGNGFLVSIVLYADRSGYILIYHSDDRIQNKTGLSFYDKKVRLFNFGIDMEDFQDSLLDWITTTIVEI